MAKSRIWALMAWLLNTLPTVLVLAALALLARWGAENDWQLKRPGITKKSEEKGPDEKENRSWVYGDLIQLKGDAVKNAGIQCSALGTRTLIEYAKAYGVLAFDPTRYAHLSARAPGIAWRVDRTIGDRVVAGEVLALVSSAEAGRARGEFLRALVQAELKQQLFARLEAAGGTIPARQLAEARAAVREAGVALLVEQQALANLGLPVQANDFRGLTEEEIANRLKTLGLPRDLITPQNALQLPANLLPIRAPFAGLILKRDLTVGELVSLSQPQFTLVDTSRIWAYLDLKLEQVARVRLGQTVIFETDPSGQSQKGRVEWISPEVEAKTRTVRARVDLSNPNGELRAGTFGQGSIEVQRVENAVAIPDEAIQKEAGAHWVFVQRGENAFVPCLILPGIRADGFTELLNPWPWDWFDRPQPGDLVVTIGAHILKSEWLKERISGDE